MDFINKIMDKGALKDLLAQVYLEFGGAKSATLANALKNLGYKYATRSGVTISIQDLSVPPEKKALLAEAEKEIDKSTNRYLKGEITEVERYSPYTAAQIIIANPIVKFLFTYLSFSLFIKMKLNPVI